MEDIIIRLSDGTTGILVQSKGLPDNCHEDLRVWWIEKTNSDRAKERVEIYKSYYEVNNIKPEDEWKVNLRKQITYNNKQWKVI